MEWRCPQYVKPGLGYVDGFVTSSILPTIPFWKRVGFTPNNLTFLGMISSGLCVWFLHTRNPAAAILFLLVRWYCDYADGLLARRYNLTSTFGDWFDHVVDVLFFIGVVVVLVLSEYKKGTGNWCLDNLRIILLSVLLAFTAAFVVQTGCVERRHNPVKANNKQETSISRLRILCPAVLEPVLKFFDNGTLYLVMIVIFVIFCNRP